MFSVSMCSANVLCANKVLCQCALHQQCVLTMCSASIKCSASIMCSANVLCVSSSLQWFATMSPSHCCLEMYMYHSWWNVEEYQPFKYSPVVERRGKKQKNPYDPYRAQKRTHTRRGRWHQDLKQSVHCVIKCNAMHDHCTVTVWHLDLGLQHRSEYGAHIVLTLLAIQCTLKPREQG